MRARAGQGGTRPDRRRDGRGRGRQVAAVLTSSRRLAIGMDGAGGVFGFARQGVGLSAGDRSAARLFRDQARKTTAGTRREKVTGKIADARSQLWRTRCPICLRCWASSRGDDPLTQMDAQIKRRRTLDAIKRILLRESLNQPLMRDLRGPALDRRADPGVSRPARRFDRHCENSSAGELSARVFASLEQ